MVNQNLWGVDLLGHLQRIGGVGGLLSVDDGDTYYAQFDANGNVVQYVDSGNTTTTTIEYSPFGKIVVGNGRKVDFTFSTKCLDRETGLTYYGHRYLDSENGRWTSRDPVEKDGGWNLYRFCNNNPLNMWDYLGREPNGSNGNDTEEIEKPTWQERLANITMAVIENFPTIPLPIGMCLGSEACSDMTIDVECTNVLSKGCPIDKTLKACYYKCKRTERWTDEKGQHTKTGKWNEVLLLNKAKK